MLGKVTKFQRIISNALKVMVKNLWGVPKDPPGLNRVNMIQRTVRNLHARASTKLSTLRNYPKFSIRFLLDTKIEMPFIIEIMPNFQHEHLYSPSVICFV